MEHQQQYEKAIFSELYRLLDYVSFTAGKYHVANETQSLEDSQRELANFQLSCSRFYFVVCAFEGVYSFDHPMNRRIVAIQDVFNTRVRESLHNMDYRFVNQLLACLKAYVGGDSVYLCKVN